MWLVIDRFEESFAVCEDESGKFQNIPIDTIDGSSKEGDVIELIGKKFYVNKKETEKRKKYVEELTKDMWK